MQLEKNNEAKMKSPQEKRLNLHIPFIIAPISIMLYGKSVWMLLKRVLGQWDGKLREGFGVVSAVVCPFPSVLRVLG